MLVDPVSSATDFQRALAQPPKPKKGRYWILPAAVILYVVGFGLVLGLVLRG